MSTEVRTRGNVRAAPQGMIHPFNYEGVRLGKSWLRDQYQHTRDYFLAIPDDDLLKGFRQRAGLPAPGEDMRGWYSGDDQGLWYSRGDTFHVFGQWLSALARMAKATGDEAARDKVLGLMAEWAKTIAPDGYFYFSTHPHTPHYIYDKICGGLVDIAQYLGSQEALAHLATITRWATKNLDRSVAQGGWPTNTEWYTISENLYRAYQVTGDPTYRDFAQAWHYTGFWDELAAGKDALIGHHAYSHVNTLGSAAMAFAVTGEPKYFATIDNAYHLIWDHHLYATGGYGPSEAFCPPNGSMGSQVEFVNPNWLVPNASSETTCGTWAAFKLNRYLNHFTGDARYSAWTEILLYNAIGASLLMTGRGRTFYYSSYMMAGSDKGYYPHLWPCCSGTYPMAVADYHNIVYYRDAGGLYVNLFLPSEVTWTHDGKTLRVVQVTAFPESDMTRLTVRTATPTECALRFRIPGWASGVTASVNGQPVATSALPGEWAEVKRTWREGDTLALTLPMRLTFVPVDAQHPRRVALMYGPVVLVADHGPTLSGDLREPASWLVPTGEPLTFRAKGAASPATFRPFYELGEGVRYWMYLDVQPS